MIFGSRNDAKLLLRIRRELLQDVIEQEILYYKVNVVASVDNIYGEAEHKSYYVPIRFTCSINRGDQSWTSEEYGPELTRKTSFAFIKDDFQEKGFRPDVGDIIEWSNSFFEVDGVNENQFWLGKDDEYRLDDDELHKFGDSVSVVLDTHLTRYKKLNIIER